MKNREQKLRHFFALARRAPARGVAPPAFGLETAVLAHWRAAQCAPAENGALLRGLRWAALIACAAALIAGALESDQLAAFRSRFDPETRVPDAAISVAYNYE